METNAMDEVSAGDQGWKEKFGPEAIETYIAFEKEIVRLRELLMAQVDAVGDDGEKAVRVMQRFRDAVSSVRAAHETEEFR